MRNDGTRKPGKPGSALLGLVVALLLLALNLPRMPLQASGGSFPRRGVASGISPDSAPRLAPITPPLRILTDATQRIDGVAILPPRRTTAQPTVWLLAVSHDREALQPPQEVHPPCSRAPPSS